MPLKAYEEFAEEPLAFPIAGKTYTVPTVSFRDGIKLQRVLSGEDKSLNDAPAEEAWRLVLGAAYDEMVADNVPMEALSRAGLAALSDFQFGRESAERVWESGLDPKALQAALAAAEKPSPASKRSRSTASATRTRKRASSPSTTSRKK